MNRKHMEKTWDEKKEEDIADMVYVEKVKLDHGERDFIAGQRDIDRVDWIVTLNEEMVEQIEFEKSTDPELGISETLSKIRQTFELNHGLSPGDDWTSWDELSEGEMYVTGSHDRRPGGSL